MARLTAFDTAEALGAHAARLAIEALSEGRRSRGLMTLGCPAGRTPRATFAALGRMAAEQSLDLSRLHLLMMDEYVVRAGDGWRRCPLDAHYSCARFGEVEIRRVLNAGLAPERQAPASQLHLPDPREPDGYERLIESLGGVDLFILASGASDGHVAFNPPGTPFEAATRVVALAETTRRDNLATFPAFRDLSEVPAWGVTVGPSTIARWSRRAVLILTGAAKAEALRRVTSISDYDPAWPSSVIHACRNAEVLADRMAAEGAEDPGAAADAP